MIWKILDVCGCVLFVLWAFMLFFGHDPSAELGRTITANLCIWTAINIGRAPHWSRKATLVNGEKT